MSYSKMLLPFLLMLYCWSISWVRLTMGGASCPAECTCWWKGNKETVECANKALVALPAGIDADTQVVNISDNNLQQLTRDTFLRANLLNLQRIYMANCNIGTIQEGAFNRLTNLVELDLSRNLVPEVPTSTFRDIPALRRLILNQNPIRRLENNAFQMLQSLVDLQLSHCQLDTVAPKAFHGLKGLTHLKLDNNRLTTLSVKSIQPLKGLHGVALHGNPWKCDCGMQEVKVWLTRYNIPYKLPPTCSQPSRVKGYTLDELQLDDLACQPHSVYSNRRTEVVIGRNASLVCEVTANPTPSIRWYRQGHPVANLTRFFQGVKMYVIYERVSSGGTDKVSVLTITAVSEQDAGEYLCVAENKAGSFSANFTLEVVFRDLEASGLTSGQIAGISLGLILVGAIVLLLICILLAKWRQAGLLGSDLKHPPLNQSQHKLVNSANHVHDYKGNHQKGGGGQVKMSFSLPRLSRSNSAQRNYSDEAASDSDRTLIENLTSPSKSSTCNLSNKPDVVNVSNQQQHNRSSSSSASSKKDKDGRSKKEKRQDKKQKEKRKERHRWKAEDDGAIVAKTSETDNKCNSSSTLPNSRSKATALQEDLEAQQQGDSLHRKLSNQQDRKSADNRCNSTPLGALPNALSKATDDSSCFQKSSGKIAEEDNRYGSYGNLKLSASNEWNKVISVSDTVVDNAAFARNHEVAGLRGGESYELIEKSWAGRANHCAALQDAVTVNEVSPDGGCGDNKTVANDVTAELKGGGCGAATLNRNSNAARFRHYVPVLPPLPAQHYSQVRNSLIRSCKGDSAEDITDM